MAYGPSHHLVFVARLAQDCSGEPETALARRVDVLVRSMDLTGIMLLGAGHAVGVLEGPRLQVFRAYEWIAADRVYAEVRRLKFEPVVAGLFGHWQVGLLEAPPQTVVSIGRLEALIARSAGASPMELGAAAIAVLRDFREQLSNATSPATAAAPIEPV